VGIGLSIQAPLLLVITSLARIDALLDTASFEQLRGAADASAVPSAAAAGSPCSTCWWP
jgi:hypothetical protein